MITWVTVLYAQEADKVYELSLDQLVNVEVTSASRFKQKSSEAPSAVDVVTSEDIRKFGWRNLADALNAMRGLYIRNDRNYTYLGNRGISRTEDYNSRVLVMIDGRRMNESTYDTAFIAEEFMLDMNLIERIEYIPGSGSSVYGANALLGVINVITKKGKDFDGLNLSGEVGSLDTYRGRATYGKQWNNGAELLINGSQYFSHGADRLSFPQFSSINAGIAQNMDIERSSRAFGKFSYGDFTFRGGYVDRYKRVPTGAYQVIFNDKENYTVDRQAYVDLDYLTQINANLGLEARVFNHWYDYHAISAYDANGGSPPLARYLYTDRAIARWWGGELKLTGTQFTHHKWIAGLEVQYDQREQLIGDDIDPKLDYNTNNKGWRAGVYVQDEYRVTNNLLINAGLRLDHHHNLKSLQLNPRIGLIWDITPKLTTKLLYSSAFRAPNASEADYSSRFTSNANTNNNEELIKSYEAVVEWYPGGGLKLLSTLFYNDFYKVIAKEPEASIFSNTGKLKTYGFELGAEKKWDNGRLFKLTWTHNYTRDESLGGGSWAQDSPKNLVKLHFAEPFFKDYLLLGFEEIFVDQRRTLANNNAPGYHLFNINLSLAKPVFGIQTSLGIYNVLDQHFKVLAGSGHAPLDTLTMDGRTVRFRLEYSF
jgi:outer membrane receptor for ferrienterochelin and colicins